MFPNLRHRKRKDAARVVFTAPRKRRFVVTTDVIGIDLELLTEPLQAFPKGIFLSLCRLVPIVHFTFDVVGSPSDGIHGDVLFCPTFILGVADASKPPPRQYTHGYVRTVRREPAPVGFTCMGDASVEVGRLVRLTVAVDDDVVAYFFGSAVGFDLFEIAVSRVMDRDPHWLNGDPRASR
jgi:hypothetical protein